ncbi:MAG TPA: DeoR/GlpR transcriptional regulator [Candidatus Choladousia intestinigallinarum]|nr:DeoR/GlpR transcriptional regulator [Candidatus Choladousia intestinigallinarum]
MLITERRNKILELVNAQGSIRVVDLAKSLNVTTETIRKDLLYLSNKGLVQKKFGGAIAVNDVTDTPPLEREFEALEEKVAIAKAALQYINGNNVIFIDSGSTLLTFVKHLPPDLEITIVTNSFSAIDSLVKTNNVIYFLGGEVSNITMSTSGFWAVNALNSIKIDVAFLGTSGFHSHNGPTSKQFINAQIKKEIIQHSAQNIVLADSSKFISNAVLQFCNWSDIDALITDSKAPSDMIDNLRKQTEVVVV